MQFSITLDDYRAYLLGIANRQLRTDLRPKVGGSDLVQETFLAAWTVSRNGTFTPDDLRFWLRGILRKHIGRCHRRFVTAAKRSVTAERSLSDVGELGDQEIGDDQLQQNELALVLAAAVEQLRPHERDVLRLRLDDDLSWQEVAQRRNLTAEAARQVFRRCWPSYAAYCPRTWTRGVEPLSRRGQRENGEYRSSPCPVLRVSF